MVRRRAASVSMAACAAGVLVLGACDSGGSPTSSTSSSTSSSPSPSTSSSTSAPASSTSSSPAYVPVKPEFPAEAKKQTLEGAQAFAEYFIALFNFAYTKPESGLVGKLGVDGCPPCEYYEKESERLVKTKSRYQSEVLTVSDSSIVSTNVTAPKVLVSGMQHEVPIVENDGSLTPAANRVEFTFRVELKWVSGTWRVVDLVVL